MSADATPQDVLEGRAEWCVVEGDCLAVLPTLAARSVAHVITDPPYSRDLYSRTRTNKGTGIRKNGRPYSSTENTARMSAMQLASNAIGAIDDILEPAAAHMLRVATRWLIAFSDCESCDLWRREFGDTYVRTGAWVKTDPMPQITGDRPAAGFEPCTIAHARPRGRMRWNGGGLAAVWTHGTCKGSARPDHPCPKPVELMLELVDLFTDVGEVVLDPFCGSSTTGVACLRLGRRFIGIEKDAKYAAIARERMTAESRGLSLRDARAGQTTIFDTLATT